MWFEGGDNILYPVINGVVDWVVWSSGVTLKTFLLILWQDRIASNIVTRREGVQGSSKNKQK